MYPEHPAWVEHQRKRWMRPDAERYWRPDAASRMTDEEARLFLPDSMRASERKEDCVTAHHIASEKEALQEQQRQSEILRLKSEIAALRFQRTMVLHAIALERQVKYDPEQPRVAAGNPDGGQWTKEGDDAGKIPAEDAHELSTVGQGNSRPKVPKQRPSTSSERTSIIRKLGRWGGRLAPIVAAGAKWLREYAAEIQSYGDPPRTFEELRDAADELPKPGYEKHHIVEQTQAEKDKYPRSMIDGPDNVVAVPKQKHRQISDWYGTKNFDDDRFRGRMPREYLRDKNWDERYQFGLEVLREFKVLQR